MNDLLDETGNLKLLFKENPIWLATLLGGPIAGAYFIARNFKETGELKLVGKTWLIAGLLTLTNVGLLALSAYFAFVLLTAIPLGNMALANILVTKFQQPFIEQHEREKGHFRPNSQTVLPIILGFIFYAIPMIIGYFVFRFYLGNN